jgi:hypothetical protein
VSNFLPRALKRHTIKDVVDVYDAMRDRYLGRLVNIHTQGLMIMGDVPIEENCLYQFDLHLPQTINGSDVIHLGVDCLWARHADHNGKHWAGFSIIDISPDGVKDILALIELLGEP